MRHMLAAFTVVFASSVAFGYVAEVDISGVAYIYNEQDEFRVLFKFDDPQISDSFRVDFATVIIPKSQDSSRVGFEVYGVTRPWSASTVGWSYPWESSGGDLSDTCLTRWVIHPGVGEPGHFIDVTEYVRSIVRGEPNYGLMIKPAEGGPSGFSGDLAPIFSQLGQLKLRVLYRGRD